MTPEQDAATLVERVERVIDAALLGEALEAAGTTATPYWDAVLGVGAPVYRDLVGAMTDKVDAPRETQVAAADVALAVVFRELTTAVFLVRDLAHRLGRRHGVDTAVVLRELLATART